MELIYDWRSFQSIFYPKRKLTSADSQKPVYVIADGRVVVEIFAEGQDLADWNGATCDEVEAEFSHRQVFVFDRAQVDQWMNNAVEKNHFYDQVQYLQKQALPLNQGSVKLVGLSHQRHFLLSSLQSWWRIFLPSSYGIYICLDQNPKTSLFLLFNNGRVVSFHVPDLSSMIRERRRVPGDVVKHISEDHLVPVQGLFLSSKDWAEWSENENPWPQVAAALRADRTQLAPLNWGVAFLVLLRGYFGI